MYLRISYTVLLVYQNRTFIYLLVLYIWLELLDCTMVIYVTFLGELCVCFVHEYTLFCVLWIYFWFVSYISCNLVS